MYDAEDPDDVDLPDELMELFAIAGDDDADMWAVGLGMVEAFTGVLVPKNAVESMSTAHPMPHV